MIGLLVTLNVMKHPSHIIDPLWMKELKECTSPAKGIALCINDNVPYGTAIKTGLLDASRTGFHVAFCDSDGYHPVSAILRICRLLDAFDSACLVKPYRVNIPFQSKVFSYVYDFWTGEAIIDATGGLWGMTSSAASVIGPRLEAADMTVHLEVEHQAHLFNFPILQFPYVARKNRTAESRRTKGYRWKLVKKLFQL